MLLSIPKVLNSAQIAECRKTLETAEWSDGKATAGYLSSRAKNNMQVPGGHPVTRRLGGMIMEELDKNQTFISAALPLKILPPLFNRYTGGESYGNHVDGSIRPVPGSPHRVRTDLSATLFLSEPDEYDGGELVIQERFGEKRVKLPAGDMVLYYGGSVHRVEPVTRGARIAAFFWIQSMVRDDTHRDLLFELDTAVQELGRAPAEHRTTLRLAGIYHNLLRLWSDT